ncbi:long-chain fatty acid--CoA ligase [Flaviflexus salsibiostraticola]|uniref:Long-chain fatty acid--CoA ligase n=1 Tax=Flaviflexus salsibiostraticola TaxID=1282737 RepID=A0A3S8ZAL5_9ACTO|nr:class I adenylate-forming enzyme family protein [Flaviflexus salsibiostraticola]AZN30505.1 long-chain fatty acid--CoA ligase [Flaviflexus salsibiostraticola]
MTVHPPNGARRGVNIGDAISAAEPDAIAIAQTDGQQVTYGEFLARVLAVQADLAARGIVRGDHVAIIGLNSIDWLAAFYGVMRAGAVIIPVSHRFPAPVLEYVLDNSDPSLILVDRDDRTTRPAVRFGELGAEPGPGQQPAAADVGWDDPALVLYTSGSTGRPKGVVRSHGSHAWILDQGERASDGALRTILVAAPLYHMNGLATVQAALLHGDRVVLQPAFEARGFLRAIAEHRVTKTTGVPPMMALALREKDLLAELDLSSVTEHSFGSAPLTDDLIDDIEAAFPNSALSISYGTTESGPVAFAPVEGRPTPKNSVGAAHPAVRIRLLDEIGRVIVSDGADAKGEASEALGSLSVSSPATFSHYLGGPASPVDEEGFYPTGDLFLRDAEGFYSFAGRVDDMFASGGENVHPAAVERALLEHPAVEEAAVVPVPDAVKGAKPVAFVVTRTDVTEQELKDWSLERMEPYAHPRRVFMTDALPLSGTNKIDRNALAERAAALIGGGA